MIVPECETCFHELAMYATSTLDTEYERVCCSIKGLRLPIRMYI